MGGQNGSAGAELYVHELHCTNIKKLRHVAVKLQPGMNRVVGENDNGKSTFIDLVRWAIGGAKEMPGEIITRGEEKAQIVLKFGDFTVERRFHKNEKGGEDSTLVLIGPDGGRLQKPQTVLDAFYDKYCFDPLAFMRMEPKAQVEVLKRLGNLSFGPLEAKRAALYEERTEVNRRGGDLKVRFQAMPTPPAELPAAPVSVDELLAQQNDLYRQQRVHDGLRSTAGRLETERLDREKQVRDQVENVRRARAALEAAEAELVRREEQLVAAVKASVEADEAVKQIVPVQLGDLTAKISAAQTTNLWLDRKKNRDAAAAELEQLRTKSSELSTAIEALDKQKADAIANVKFPVEKLSFTDAAPIFDGFALAEASAAIQLRVSVAIGIALNPKLRLMLVRDAALMGTEQLELLKQLAVERKAQLLVELAARDAKDLEVMIQEGDVVVVQGQVKVKGQQDLGIVVEGRQP